MVNGGDWILMHFNGAVYGDKPRFFSGWLLFHPTCGKGSAPSRWDFHRGLWDAHRSPYFSHGKKTLFISNRIPFSPHPSDSVHFIYLSTRANIDVTLTFFTTTSLFCFFLWYGYGSEKGLNENRHLESLLILRRRQTPPLGRGQQRRSVSTLSKPRLQTGDSRRVDLWVLR